MSVDTLASEVLQLNISRTIVRASRAAAVAKLILLVDPVNKLENNFEYVNLMLLMCQARCGRV